MDRLRCERSPPTARGSSPSTPASASSITSSTTRATRMRPVHADEASLRERSQRRVDRALVELESVADHLFAALDESVAISRLLAKETEQGPLEPMALDHPRHSQSSRCRPAPGRAPSRASHSDDHHPIPPSGSRVSIRERQRLPNILEWALTNRRRRADDAVALQAPRPPGRDRAQETPHAARRRKFPPAKSTRHPPYPLAVWRVAQARRPGGQSFPIAGPPRACLRSAIEAKRRSQNGTVHM